MKKITPRTRGSQTLTAAELNKIRNFLPVNWRQLIQQKHNQLTLRQITEVFAQRTNNPVQNEQVWTVIKITLENVNQQRLAQRVNDRILFCTSLYNVIQKCN